MMIVVSYDIDTSDESGAKRLRRVARTCEAFGYRVQNSVFEILAEPAQYVRLKSKLNEIIDSQSDSIRFYRLGANWKPRIETLGKKLLFEQDETIIL